MNILWVLIIVGLVFIKYVKDNVGINNNVPPFEPINQAEEEETEEEEFEEESESEQEQDNPVIVESTPTPTSTPTPQQPVTERFDKTPQKQVERLFGIIGKPLEHSISITYFKKKFRAEQISADYRNFEIDSAEELKTILEENPNLCGLNVTIPYKQDVIPMMDRLDESAAQVGAVNVIKVVRNEGKVELVGYNTDAIGFEESIAPLLEDRNKALILGTGGVSKAVKYALDKLGVESKFVSRNSNFDILGYYELSPSVMDEYSILINCTPVGMWPDSDKCPDIPYAYISDKHLLYDVIYRPEETLFMKKGSQNGAIVKNGYEMWQRQADATWRIWNE